MTYKNYINDIVKDFGTKESGNALRQRLYKLINKVKENDKEYFENEKKKQPVVIERKPEETEEERQKREDENIKESLKQYLNKTLPETIDKIMNSTNVTYQKTLLIIYTFKHFGGFWNIREIPENCFFDIFNYYEEGKFGIEFTTNAEDEYQFIRIK